MVRKYTRKRPYKYTFKQMEYWKRKSKKELAKKKWEALIRKLKEKVRKELIREDIEESKRQKVLLWAKQQEIDVKKDIYNKIKMEKIVENAKRRIQKRDRLSKPIMSYLKSKYVGQIRRQYSEIVDSPKKAYDSLLNNALTKPKEFKELIISQMDKLKHLLEIEMEFISLNNRKTTEQARAIIRGNTLEEIKMHLQETGINIGEVMDSIQFKEFLRLCRNENSAMYTKVNGGLVNISFLIRLKHDGGKR